MLDTFMVLILFGALAVLGCLMGFFGGRYFRPFAFLIGFGGGVLLVMFLISSLAPSISLTSLPAIIGAGGVGIVLGLLSVVFRHVGIACTGIAAGLAMGAGIVFCANYLLNDMVPALLYTFLSVLIASIIALSCLARPNTGKAFSTSIMGGFATVTAIGMVVAWFASQRGDLAQMLKTSDSLLSDAQIIYEAMSDKTLALYIVSCLLLGIAMFALQTPYIEQAEIEPGIDELEGEPFDGLKDGPQKKEKRPKREKRDTAKEKREKKDRREKKRKRKRRFSEEEDFNEEYDDYDEYGEDDYDEDYAELDAMIEKAGNSLGDGSRTDDDEDDYGQDDDDYDEDFDDEIESEEIDLEGDEQEIAFSAGKKTITANGEEQPAHGPLRPKNLPDEDGFEEKAVPVDPSEVEENTVIFAPVTEEEPPKKSKTPSLDSFSERKPTFKRDKTLTDDMDYDPQESFTPRTSRKKKRK